MKILWLIAFLAIVCGCRETAIAILEPIANQTETGARLGNTQAWQEYQSVREARAEKRLFQSRVQQFELEKMERQREIWKSEDEFRQRIAMARANGDSELAEKLTNLYSQMIIYNASPNVSEKFNDNDDNYTPPWVEAQRNIALQQGARSNNTLTNLNQCGTQNLFHDVNSNSYYQITPTGINTANWLNLETGELKPYQKNGNNYIDLETGNQIIILNP